MTRQDLVRLMVAAMLFGGGASGAAAADVRAKADVACQPTATALVYDCAIKLTDARSGVPLTGVQVTVGADMPSMPMAHNVRPARAKPAARSTAPMSPDPGAMPSQPVVDPAGPNARTSGTLAPTRCSASVHHHPYGTLRRGLSIG